MASITQRPDDVTDSAFDADAFLASAGLSKTIVRYARDESIFAQGDASNHVLYVQSGGVKLSVLSKRGKEAVIAMLGPGDFFGEGCLAGQPVRMGSATAITPSAILRVEKAQMVRVLHRQREAGVDPPAVGEHRAGAARALVASLLGAGQAQVLAQRVEQTHLW